jgi:hypothetical protein
VKKSIVCTALACIFVFVSQASIPRRIVLVGMGRATESDRSAADSEAYDSAQVNANSSCIGVIENNNYTKTFDSCGSMTDEDGNVTWMCSVNVRVICLVGR